MTAYLLVALALVHAVDCARAGRGNAGASAAAVAIVLLLQAMLGIATLLWHVPLALALAHQAVAIVALVVATLHAHSLRSAKMVVAARLRSEPVIPSAPMKI
jgi:cytochrome c oxidase assembly protein subunit 15